MIRRLRATTLVLSLALLALVGGSLSAASIASASTASHPGHALSFASASAAATPRAPLDHVTCALTPDVPYQYGRGAPVHGDAHITCTPHAPDVCSVTTVIWRYDANRKHYYQVGENTSNHCGTSWYVNATGNCTAKIAYAMHVEVEAQFFYGNWASAIANSRAVTLYC
jgi:hypothetical protein